jgi:diguanylate cyclase (GGDEF)-like protein
MPATNACAHHGMAASDTDNSDNSHGPHGGSIEFLTARALRERVREEVNRAGRHGTALSCLCLDIEDLAEIARLHGPLLAERTVAYAGLTLRGELRGFDRVGRHTEGELLVVLPGADGARGEIVARRLLERLRAIKLETHGERRALRMAIGLATWRDGVGAEPLLAQARAAAGRERLVFRDALRL